jgi:uncharacterized protein YndB with AHSA1/START domain
MTKQTPPPHPAAKTKQVRLERTYPASIEDVWELWTTKEGIESWWGPDGFAVTVNELALEPGGELSYAMTAVSPETIAFMKRANMSTTTISRIVFSEVSPPSRLVYRHSVDFVPGVEPYDTGVVLELETTKEGVRLVLTIDAMHDEEWTQRAVMGWESELGKLGRVLAG